MKNNKGITLVALIITIIVMMILVAVSVTVALDRGLFSTAKKAGIETQAKAEEEMLLSAVVGSINEKAEVDFDKLDKNLPTGFTGENGAYTSSNGNVFQVLKTGEIVQGWIDNGNETYTKGDKTIELGETTATNSWLKQEVQKLGGTYQGDWQVIGLEGTKLKLVTTTAVGDSVWLGYEDPRAKVAIPAVDESAPTDAEKYKRSIWSFQNAINTLNDVAQKGTGIESARSIKQEDIYGILGEENINKGENYGVLWRYYFNNEYVYSQHKIGIDEDGNEIWSEGFSTGKKTHTFIDENGKKVIVDSEGDEVYIHNNWYGSTLTDEQRTKLGSLIEQGYWMATQQWSGFDYAAYFNIALIWDRNIHSYALFQSNNTNRNPGGSWVRAVITI